MPIVSSASQIWKSKLSWKIAINAFLTILIVQGALLYFGIRDFEQERLDHLREIARSAVVPILDNRMDTMLSSPISDENAQKLLSSRTIVTGLTIYSNQFEWIGVYGEPSALVMMNRNSLSRTHRSRDGGTYEVVFRSSDLGRPYIIVARLDSKAVQDDLIDFFIQNLVVIGLLSGLVTTVLMIALGHWLLEPILFLRRELKAAAVNPENPKVEVSKFDPKDEVGNAIELAQDLIKRNAKNIKQIKGVAEDQIHKLAFYDTMTGLPNRTSFLQDLETKMVVTDIDNVQDLGVLTIDLDHFKDINDSMGHNVGDAILRGVGKRLRTAMPDSAVVSRSGEDEFAISIPLDDSTGDARAVGERVLEVIRGQSFDVFNEQFQVRCSIGVATFPRDGHEPDMVLKNADIALNRSKEEGRDGLKEYSEDFDRAVQERFQMLRDLRDALEHEQLSLHYQPQLDLNTGRVIGAEALLRWWKPDNSKEGGSYIRPDFFIPVAEQSGLIVPIGEQVMDGACRLMKQWNDRHGQNIRIAVNVSGVQFSQSNLVEFVDKTLKKYDLEPRLLELEVTESIFMDDIEHTIQTLKDLHALGVELAIDDFGTGYSSLSYLRQFPIDRLKIDQSFIRNALNDEDDASIAKTIIALGRALNLKVIAEGVETAEHETFLIEQGCDEVQGYRYSRPLPADDFERFLVDYDGDISSFSS